MINVSFGWIVQRDGCPSYDIMIPSEMERMRGENRKATDDSNTKPWRSVCYNRLKALLDCNLGTNLLP